LKTENEHHVNHDELKSSNKIHSAKLSSTRFNHLNDTDESDSQNLIISSIRQSKIEANEKEIQDDNKNERKKTFKKVVYFLM
jgi:hypothetical protein